MTTLHGVGFGEYQTVTTKGDYLAAVMVAVSYWCTIFMAAIIMLSQLPGGDPPGIIALISQIAKTVWPSYSVFVGFAFVVGFLVGPYAMDGITPDEQCKGSCETGRFNAIGVNWLWYVMHRAPMGDIYPDTPFGRVVTVPAFVISYLYPPYVLALIAIRRPTSAEHADLVARIIDRPEEAMGPGYMTPASNAREMQMP